MFRVSQHPSSGVLKTVTAASGTGHNTGTAISLQCGLIETGLCVRLAQTPDDGCCDTRNMQSDVAVNKQLHTVASVWIFINISKFITQQASITRTCSLTQLVKELPQFLLYLTNDQYAPLSVTRCTSILESTSSQTLCLIPPSVLDMADTIPSLISSRLRGKGCTNTA